MNSMYTIRPFKPRDLGQVININHKCLPENYSTFFFMDLYERFPASFLVAEKNGKLVGYIMCRVEIGMTSFKRIGIQRKGHVISIAVLSEHRRQGIGCSLIREAMKTLILYNAKECILEVRRSNSPAVNLYKKMGFSIIKTEAGYYSDGEDAYKMARTLPYEKNESPELL